VLLRRASAHRFLAGLAILAGLAPLTASSPVQAQKPRAERPTYSLGEKWIRSDGVYELIRVEKDVYVFSAGKGREIHLTKDLVAAKTIKDGVIESEVDPPLPLRWPLEVGKWGKSNTLWRSTFLVPNIMGGRAATSGTNVVVTWNVEAYEEVHTAAGTFKAFRITHTFDIPLWRGPSWTISTWYAPEVRQIIKAESPFDVGLQAFQVVAIDRPGGAPLRVALEDPKDQARVAVPGILLAGKVSSGKGVASVTIALNGREVSRQEERRAPKPEVALSLPLKLSEGKNVLLVTATDVAGATRQEARTLFYDMAAPPRAPPAATPPPVAALPPLQVTISSPRDQARLEQEQVALAGLASGGKGINRVVVTLNGQEVARQAEVTPKPAVPVNLPLKLAEGQNTLVVTATDAGGAVHQEVRTVHYERLLPLTVTFRFPEDRATVGQETSVVAALVTSSKGVAKVRVTLNGMDVHEQVERAPQKSVLVTVPVTLKEGANTIALTAHDADGTVRQDLRTVVYDKPKVATATPAPLPPPPKPAPDRWAVIVGIGRYESSDIPRLRYTVPDAEAVYQVLTGPAGFKREHVLLLTDKTEKKPTYRNLKWALGTFLARSAKKDDTVLIFFAGHGAPEVDQRGVERDGFSKYLVPADAEPDDLYSTAFPMDELQTIFARIEAERVVVFLDACYSGAAGGRTFLSKKTRSGHVDDLFLERLARSKGRAILTASRSAEVSLELPELGHGIFTYYLIQGLRGAADGNRDGIVTLQELYEYVEQQVSQKSRAVGGNQHPVMKGELEGVLPLVKVGRR
jgi:hypothetical protein